MDRQAGGQRRVSEPRPAAAPPDAGFTGPEGKTWLIVSTMRLSHERPVRKPDHDGEQRSRMECWLVGLATLGFETYYPMIREMKRVPADRLSRAQRASGVSLMRPRVVPFLPGRVFVRERSGIGRIADHPGVVGFLCVGGEPARISNVLIDNLRRREAAGGGAIPGGTPVEYIFRPGDEVEVVDGGLAGQKGRVEVPPNVALEAIDSDTILRLAIDIFGRPTRVDVAVGRVRKI